MQEKNENGTITGTYQAAGRDVGFLIPEGSAPKAGDYFIPPRRSGGAWDGDKVEAQAAGEDPQRPGRPCARVVKVLERKNKVVTGTVVRLGRESWLRPDNDRLPAVKIGGGKLRAQEGHKAAVSVSNFGTDRLPPLGSVRADFGPSGSRKSSTEAILYQQGICREFPSQVRSEAGQIRLRVGAAECRRRLDLRKKTVITIDGAASKDLDDAVSLERDGDGDWILGVHIADVSHYVPTGSALDVEAYERGTSVYFADQVIPMLPQRLSNGICSLNPGVDRLTISCVMTLSPQGELLSYEVRPSVIRSTERMTYDDCNVLLDPEARRQAPELVARYEGILPMLLDMGELARTLKKRRRARGSLDLETTESYVICDDAGAPVEIAARRQGQSEELIESFMLIANETVARHLGEQKSPGVYRVHEKPSQEKVEALRAMLSPLGFALKDGSSQSYQKAVDAFRGSPKAPAVSMMVLRSLMKARYAPEDLGHFGIAAEHYCHFTSPIRRYPDLMVHRCLHALWDKQEQNATRRRKLAAACQRASVQASARELAAQSAERDIEKLYFAEHMLSHIGEELDAAVSGVTKFGLFAALPNGVEGLIPVEALPDDRYVYDEVHLSLTGERRGESYTFGMPLRVVCVAADPGTGKVDFRLSGREEVPVRRQSAPAPIRTQERRAGRGGRGRSAMHVPKRGHRGRRR